jgi:hypothetical protein
MPFPRRRRIRFQARASFASIADTDARSAALFTELGKVLTHPRRINCHPAADRPRQGDQSRLISRRLRPVLTGMAFLRCDVLFAMGMATSNPAACQAIPTGTA